MRADFGEVAQPRLTGTWGSVAFSKRQQEQFGVDQEGNIVDPGQFEVALESLGMTTTTPRASTAAASTSERPTEPPTTAAAWLSSTRARTSSSPSSAAIGGGIARPAAPQDMVVADRGQPDLPPQCSHDDASYLPLDMVGEVLSYVANASECQARCAVLAGCKHFTFSVVDKACHVTDGEYLELGSVGFVAGPAACGGSVGALADDHALTVRKFLRGRSINVPLGGVSRAGLAPAGARPLVAALCLGSVAAAALTLARQRRRLDSGPEYSALALTSDGALD